MSLRATLWAYDQAPVSNPAAVLILAALADEANDAGEGACPYMEKLTHRGRCAERTAQAHLRELFRLRLINLGDPAVARRRYRKSAGKVPRVWDLNLAATWENVPTPRTDEEMLQYSDKIGQRPVRRQEADAGVQDLHPSESDPLGGVQDLHPTEDQADDQAEQTGIDDSGRDGSEPWGAEGCTPWGADPDADGVQRAAPFPTPAYSPNNPPLVAQLTTGAAEALDAETGGDSSQQTNRLDEIVAWFARRRSDWGRAAIEDALTTAVVRELGTLGEAAAALRELAEGKHGPTDSPRRLCALPNAEWWSNAKARRASAAAATLAASPRCSKRGHERQPAAACALCKGEAKGRPDTETTPSAAALARAEAILTQRRPRPRKAATRVAS